MNVYYNTENSVRVYIYQFYNVHRNV